MTSDHDGGDEKRPSGDVGPVDLARAVFSWILVAIATLVIVWLLVFAATRGDALGLLVVLAVGIVLALVGLLRRRRL